jgi:rhodanese-related sulfurtransferase
MPVAVREIDPLGLAAARRDGAVVIDVREPHEYIDGHVPGAQLVPLGAVERRVDDIRQQTQGDDPVYLICRTGVRSADAARMLERADVRAISVAGGTEAWKSAGMDVVAGPHAC